MLSNNCFRPKNSLEKKTDFTIGQNWDKKLFPAIKSNKDTFLTNVVSLNPDKTSFNEPVSCKLYYKTRVSNAGAVQVLYNDDMKGKSWRYLGNFFDKPDDPVFEAKNDHVIIKFHHFCDVVALETPNRAEFRLEELVFALKIDHDRALTHVCLDVFKVCNFDQVHMY